MTAALQFLSATGVVVQLVQIPIDILYEIAMIL